VIGTTEIILIIVVILLLFGAKKLPELARGMGKSVQEFKKGVKEGIETQLEKNKSTITKNSTLSPILLCFYILKYLKKIEKIEKNYAILVIVIIINLLIF
jgi:sec-independent protein translocase protein TatA